VSPAAALKPMPRLASPPAIAGGDQVEQLVEVLHQVEQLVEVLHQVEQLVRLSPPINADGRLQRAAGRQQPQEATGRAALPPIPAVSIRSPLRTCKSGRGHPLPRPLRQHDLPAELLDAGAFVLIPEGFGLHRRQLPPPAGLSLGAPLLVRVHPSDQLLDGLGQ
jgi:hypothetical protein